VAAANQASLSILSFAISIILIKNVSKVEYGYYSIAFASWLFVSSIHQAIVNTPLAVLLAEKKDRKKKNYAGALCYGQYFIIIPAVVLGLVVIAILSFYSLDSTQTWVAISVCLAVGGMLLRLFLRAYLFAEERPHQVFKVDTLYIVLLLGSIVLTHLIFKLSTASVFILMGINGLMVGLYFSRNRGWQYNWESIKESYSENWQYGKWALFGGIVTYVQYHSYLYLVAALIGSHAVAEVSAARLLIMPFILFRAGWGTIAIPHGSKLREQNQLDRFFKELVIGCILYVFIVSLYATLLMSFSGVLQKFIFTQNYAKSFDYFLYWVLVNIIGFAGLSASFGMQVTKNFDILSKINFLTMLVTLGSAYILISSFGVIGALIAMIIGGLFSAAVQWFYLFRVVFLKKLGMVKIGSGAVLKSKPLKNETYKTG
jgi:O-antigen/teichoic acid export membrane protein